MPEMHSAAANRNSPVAPAIWPSLARITATLVVFFYHYSGLLGVSQARLGSYAVMIFCFLSGYLANVSKRDRGAWFVRRYLGIMIPYWLIIVPVIVANQVFQYKPVGLWTQIVTILGGNLFLDNPLYVIAWYVTFVLLLYLYALAESFCNSWQKILCMAAGVAMFWIWSEVGKYFVAFLVGLRASEWQPLRAPLAAGVSVRRVASFLFKIQRYCYPFFLIHGAVLLVFARKTSVSPLGLFWLSLAVTAVLSAAMHAVSKALERIVFERILLLFGKTRARPAAT